VTRILKIFIELCLLRAAPQDLPASATLLYLAFAANAFCGALVVSVVQPLPAMALVEALADAALMLSCLWLGLNLLGRLPRFNQSACAVLGSGAVLSLAAFPLLKLSEPAIEGQVQPHPASALLLVLVLWSLVVMGNILRHTFELRLSSGILIAFGYNVLSYVVLNQLFVDI
jgi:hypothetical protein